MFGGAWQFIKSEYVSTQINARINSVLKPYGHELNVESLLPSLPFGTTVNNAEMKLHFKTSQFDITASKISFDFDFISFFTRRIKIKRIALSDVSIVRRKLNINKNDAPIEIEAFDASRVHKLISRELKKLPFDITQLQIIRTLYKENDLNIMLPKVMVRNVHDEYKLQASIENYSNESIQYLNSVNLNVSLTENFLSIIQATFQRGLNTVSLTGKIKDSANISLSVDANGDVAEAAKWFRFNKIVKKAQYKVTGKYRKENNAHSFTGKVSVSDLSLPWMNFAKGSAHVQLKDQVLSLSKIRGYDQTGGSIRVTNQNTPVYDLKNKKILLSQIPISLNKVNLGNLLKYVNGPALEIQGATTGLFLLTWNKNTIKISTEKSVSIKKFRLLDILNFKETVHIEDFILSIPLVQSAVTIVGKIRLNKSKLNVTGRITSDEVEILAPNSLIELSELGKIGGVPLSGETKGDFSVIEKGTKSYLQYQLSGKKFSVLNYFLGNPVGSVQYLFNNKQLKVKINRSALGQASIAGNGIFDFNKGASSALDIDIKNAEIKDLEKALRGNLSKGLLKWSFLLQGRITSAVRYEGILSKKSFSLDIEAVSPYLFVMDEPFENFRLRLKDINNLITIPDFKLRKNKKSLEGSAILNLDSNSFKYKIIGEPIGIQYFESFRKLGLNFDTQIIFESSGKGTFSDFSSRTLLKLKDTTVSSKKLGSSFVEMYNLGQEFFVTANLFGKEIESSLYLNIGSKDRSKRSFAELKLGVADINKYLAVLNPSLLRGKEIKGAVSFYLNSDFLWSDLTNLNLKFELNNFFLKTQKDFVFNDEKQIFSIKNGYANQQEISINGKFNEFKCFANGAFGKDFVADINLDTTIDWIEIMLSNIVEKSEGKIHLSSHIKNHQDKYEFSTYLTGRGVSITPKSKSLTLASVSFDLEQNNRDFFLRSCKGKVNSGSFSIDGKMRLEMPYPDLFINYNISNAQINFLKNSTIAISSFGKISGAKAPYSLEGGVNLESGLIASELSEISVRNKEASYDMTYLPKIMRVEQKSLLNLDLDFAFSNPLVVQNSLVELYLKGRGKIRGDLHDPLPLGQIDIESNRSKFMFKGNDFIISKGIIKFSDIKQDGQINPSLMIIGQSTVGQHNVTVEVKGDTQNPIPTLRSEPSLGQEDILSLLMIGITSNQAENMDENERQIATSVGIGSIFANQLKLGKELNNMFGVKLSVMPELSQDNGNYADAISSTGNGAKLKTSTKIQLRKKIKDNVELSFSSTVGGSSEQIQKINVNYNFDKNISLEGLYEIRDTSIENRITQPESFGIDLKFIKDFE